MGSIFIVEDEEKIAGVLEKYISAEGHKAVLFSHGGSVVEEVKQQLPTMILLDVMLPEKNGIDICKEVRRFSNVPIIMITAKVEEIDRLLGLELGADDYVCKPFSPREVIARIKSVLRRSASKPDQVETAHPLTLDKATCQAALDGRDLELTQVEFRVLRSLSERPIRPWRRSQLLDRMYDDHREVCDRTVDSHVANLRKKLKKVRLDSDCIQSVYGVGYQYLE